MGREINETKSLLLQKMQRGGECFWVLIYGFALRFWDHWILPTGPKGCLLSPIPQVAHIDISHPLPNIKQSFCEHGQMQKESDVQQES